ncbi:MoxR family ATPase [Aeromonas veronii]|uniref:MoxR family ATPase n=1 Tax=Aeromonas veronii TaxID=654 RepID=UPI0031FCD7DA
MTTSNESKKEPAAVASLIIEASKHVNKSWQELAHLASNWMVAQGLETPISKQDLASLAACMMFTGKSKAPDAGDRDSFFEFIGVKQKPKEDLGAGVAVEIDGCKGMLRYRLAKDMFDTTLRVPIPTIEWADQAPHSVPQINPFYEVTPVFHDVLTAMAMGFRSWLFGHTGTGKTAAIREICARCSLPLVRINFDSEMTRADLVGKTELLNDGGTTVSRFIEGVLPRALPHVGVVLLDELDFIRPDLAYVMQAVLEGDELVLTGDNGRRVPVHPQCWIVAAANTCGQGDDVGLYRGAREQSAAFLNRFQTFIDFEYMEWPKEAALLERETRLPTHICEKLCLYAKEHREAFGRREVLTPISYRQLVTMANRMMFMSRHAGVLPQDGVWEAMELVVFNAMPAHERVKMTGIAQRLSI